MSYVAIGSVTKAIVELLDRKLNKPPLMQGSFRVTALPPDDSRVSDQNGVNLYLYRVSENAFLNNMPWPGDRTHRGSSRPPLALVLNYLLTSYVKPDASAAQEDIIAHQVLGNAMSILHDHPVLNDVHDADFDADVDALFAPELRDSFEKVKITLLPIPIDEFSKIWNGQGKAYRLSVAYEVSLVQIAPLVPTPAPRPVAVRPVVKIATIGPPILESVTPAVGAVSTEVTLTGGRFTLPGRATSVRIGGVQIEQGDLVRLTPQEIAFTVPAGVRGGPVVEVQVVCGDLESIARAFEVRPWISSLRPLRGITGVPIEIPFEVPPGAAASVEIDGQAAATTVDAARKVVRAVVPQAIASNGPKPVTLLLGTPAERSNTLIYEVMPAILSFTATNSVGPPKTDVAVDGERLSGSEVFIRYMKLLARVDTTPGGVNTASHAEVQFDRTLATGGPVSVLVDGRETNPLPRRLDRIEPAAAGIGEAVSLIGSGLSGRSVTVSFGGTAVPVGAQPFATQFSVPVPAGLAPGPVAVTVTVDGAATNALNVQISS